MKVCQITMCIPTFCFVLKKRLFLCRCSLKSSKMQRGTPFLVHSNSTTHGGLGNTGQAGHFWRIHLYLLH